MSFATRLATPVIAAILLFLKPGVGYFECPAVGQLRAEPPRAGPAEAKADDRQVQRSKRNVAAGPDDLRQAVAQASPEDETTAGDAPLASSPGLSQEEADLEYELLRSFADALDQVERNYVRPISRRELIDAAIEGVLSKLDDYSDYYTPDDWSDFRQTVESEYGGIGIQVAPDPDSGYLRVVSPILGSPAYRAGVVAGDLIVQIDGQDVHGMRLDSAVELMKGKMGTKVRLTVIHPHDGQKEELSVDRQVIQLETILGYRRQSDHSWDYWIDPQQKIAYVHVTAFSPRTAQQLEQVLAELTDEGLEGLVLDLRYNPGGMLSAAVEVADLFVSEGLIVSTEGRNVARREWHAGKEGTFEGFRMAVLVNHFSASASEIVAACLQDHSRAAVVGERTWGKGNVQNVIELEGGRSGLKITTASYFRPSGENIHRFEDYGQDEPWGVRPDEGMEVQLSRQQVAAMQARWRAQMVLATDADSEGDEPPDPLQEDPQLQRALEVVKREGGGEEAGR